jgi:hypothetical protein
VGLVVLLLLRLVEQPEDLMALFLVLVALRLLLLLLQMHLFRV